MERKEKVWVPLEGNPQIFTEFAQKIGYPTIMFQFHDVFDLSADSWACFIPQPVLAVIFLYNKKPE